jgi:hypothetical protein
LYPAELPALKSQKKDYQKRVVTNGVVTRLPIGEIIFKAPPMVY